MKGAQRHILFVSKEAQARYDWRVMAWDAPVLTVGETDNFLDEGGSINLFLRQGTIRFGVNLDSTERAGLKVSSRMLNLADEVTWPRGGRR